MNVKRVVIDAPATPIRGPWEEQARTSLPAAVPQTDPRLELSEQALVVANTNAYPIVARQKSRRDSLGLAAGAAVALVLGCATFLSLNSGRHAPASTGTAVVQAPNRAGVPMLAPPAGKPMVMPPAAAPTPAQSAATPHATGTMAMPGMPPASAPVLVYDGSSAPMATVTSGPNTPRAADGAPAMLAGGMPGGSA